MLNPDHAHSISNSHTNANTITYAILVNESVDKEDNNNDKVVDSNNDEIIEEVSNSNEDIY